MSPVHWDAAAIFSRVAGRVEEVVNATAQQVAEDARERAPVRKVFRAPRRSLLHGFGPQRLLARPGVLKTPRPLTVRGRYELRTGRANIQVGNQQYVGGRLRSEIHAEPASSGSVITARVVSPTPYAKYVEFGTRHNRAQPYLRPALAHFATAYRTQLAKAVA